MACTGGSVSDQVSLPMSYTCQLPADLCGGRNKYKTSSGAAKVPLRCSRLRIGQLGSGAPETVRGCLQCLIYAIFTPDSRKIYARSKPDLSQIVPVPPAAPKSSGKPRPINRQDRAGRPPLGAGHTYATPRPHIGYSYNLYSNTPATLRPHLHLVYT